MLFSIKSSSLIFVLVFLTACAGTGRPQKSYQYHNELPYQSNATYRLGDIEFVIGREHEEYASAEELSGKFEKLITDEMNKHALLAIKPSLVNYQINIKYKYVRGFGILMMSDTMISGGHGYVIELLLQDKSPVLTITQPVELFNPAGLAGAGHAVGNMFKGLIGQATPEMDEFFLPLLVERLVKDITDLKDG